MTGSIIKIGGATFTSRGASLRLPSNNGCVGEYVLGGSEASSIRNLANLSAPLTPSGTGLYTDHEVVVGSGGTQMLSSFDTGIVTPADATLIVIVRNWLGLGPWIGRFGSTWNGLCNYSSVPALYNSHGGTLTATADLPKPSHTNSYMVAASMPQGQQGKIHLWTGGVRAEATGEANGGASRDQSVTLQIGGFITSMSNSTLNKMSYVAIFNRLLTTAELEAAYLSLKNFYDGKLVIS